MFFNIALIVNTGVTCKSVYLECASRTLDLLWGRGKKQFCARKISLSSFYLIKIVRFKENEWSYWSALDILETSCSSINQNGLHHRLIYHCLHIFSDVYNGTVTFLPLEENSEGKYQIKKCNIYQIQLTHVKDEEW